MKLKNWRVENYKSIKSAELEVSDLTVLIGKNNSGKSNVLDSLADFCEAWEGVRNEDNAWFERRVTGKNDSKEIAFQFEFKLSQAEHDQVLNELSEPKWDDAYKHGWFSKIVVNMKISDGPNRNFEIQSNWQGEMRSLEELRTLTITGHVHSRISNIIDHSLQNWRFLSAFRMPRDTGQAEFTPDDLSDDGSNLVQKLFSLRNSDSKEKFQEIRNSYIDIMEGVSDLDIKFDLDTSHRIMTTEIGEERFERGFKSEEISAGSKEILTLLTKIHLAEEDTDLLAIEEPELHLHPEAEREVFEKITDLVEERGVQVMVATHSDVFVDEIEAGAIVRVERDGDTDLRSVEEGEIRTELADLGYNKSGLLQSEAVVFVEGRSDKLILSQWADNLGFNLQEEGISVVELEGEGNIGTHGRSLVKLLYSFDIPYIFLLDSDEQSPHDAIEHHKKKINREDDDDIDEEKVWWHTTPDYFSAWSNSDIEYFFLEAPAAIADVVGEEQATIEQLIEDSDAKKNSEILEEIWGECYTDSHGITSYQKDLHGKMVAKQMDESQMPEEVHEVIDEIRGLV